jgi:hypothetical protein
MGRVLVAFEHSGVVRRAFSRRGHDVWSVDLLPADDAANTHIVGDARDHFDRGWDLIVVAHPPCTRLCNSGVRWLTRPPAGRTVEDVWAELEDGVALFTAALQAPAPRVVIENPVMHRHARERIPGAPRASQWIQPWWFGDPHFKRTGLWLRGVPKLVPTNRLTPPARGTAEHKAWSKIHRASPGPDRWRLRSLTPPGLADAMADQWGGLLDAQEAA